MGAGASIEGRLRVLLEQNREADLLYVPEVRGAFHKGRLAPHRASDMLPEVFVDEEGEWVAKSTERGKHKVGAEFLASLLARRMGLLTPSFGVIDFNTHRWFACRWLAPSHTLAEADAWSSTSGSSDFARLLAFDWLIENRDRKNRQNTLVVMLGGKARLVTIDHSHSGVGSFNSAAGRGIMPESQDFGEFDKDILRRAVQRMDVVEETCELAASIPRGEYLRAVELTHLALGEEVFGGLGEVLHRRAVKMKDAIRSRWVR